MVPTVELPPSTPDTSQFTAPLLAPETVARNCCAWPTCTLALSGEIDTDTESGLTETKALADAVDWAALRAVTVIEPEGTDPGAVYRPDDEMVPTIEFPASVPLTSQLTAVLLVPETVALNCCECFTSTLALVGEIETETGAVVPAFTETHALAMAVVRAALCAVILTHRDRPPRGALYRPFVEMVPTSEFPPSLPFTNQFTRWFVVPVTDALNWSDCPSCIVELSGEIDTFIETVADASAHNAKQSPMVRTGCIDAFFMPDIFGDAGRNGQRSRRTSQRYIDGLRNSFFADSRTHLRHCAA